MFRLSIGWCVKSCRKMSLMFHVSIVYRENWSDEQESDDPVVSLQILSKNLHICLEGFVAVNSRRSHNQYNSHCKLPLKEVIATRCLFPFRANSHSHGTYRWLTLTLLRYWFQPPGVVHLLRALDPWSPSAQTNSQTHAQLKKAAKPPIRLIRTALGRKAIQPKCIDLPHSAW